MAQNIVAVFGSSRPQSLITRMLKLIEIAHAYVILKGRTGTLLELAAVWELTVVESPDECCRVIRSASRG